MILLYSVFQGQHQNAQGDFTQVIKHHEPTVPFLLSNYKGGVVAIFFKETFLQKSNNSGKQIIRMFTDYTCSLLKKAFINVIF